jgi:hypothetical protein
MINWDKVEKTLYQITKENIIEISKEHHSKKFYAFALSINADYGEIMLALNTVESLKETAKDYFNRHPDQYGSVEKAVKDLYWSIGDWNYEEENSEDFQDTWDYYQELISDESIDQDEELEGTENSINEKFLSLACRVAHKLDKEKVFNFLNQTSNFKYIVCDHDEADEDSWQRLEKTKL